MHITQIIGITKAFMLALVITSASATAARTLKPSATKGMDVIALIIEPVLSQHSF